MDTVLPEALRQADRPVLVSHALCPYVQRAAIALAEKGTPFLRVDIDLARKPDWFLRLGPLGRTPVLLVPRPGGPVAVWESAVIVDYLDESHAPALHPADPLERARHRGWIAVASDTLERIWQLYTAPDRAAFERSVDALRARVAQLESALGDGPWFAGRQFSLVDAAFAPAFRYFEVFAAFWPEPLFAPAPRVCAWQAALAARASVRGAVAADYPARLRAFVEAQGGWLGALSARHASGSLA